MTALPLSTAFTDSAVTEGEFKTAITNQRDFLAGLLGADGEKSTALQTLGALGNDTVAKTSNYTVIATDRGVVFVCTGTFTLSLTAAATLADGFTFAVINVGTGIITIDPSSTEQIDGANTKDIAAGSWAIVSCTGTAFYSMGSTPSSYTGRKIEVLSSSGIWVVPSDVSRVTVFVYGGGGGGGGVNSTTIGGRGGLGIGYIEGLNSGDTISYTIGSGGGPGAAGTSSSFGTYITATGGGGAGASNGTPGASSYSIPSGIQLGGGILEAYPDFYAKYTATVRPLSAGTGALAWTISNIYAPGSPGTSNANTSILSGGVGGGIFIIY